MAKSREPLNQPLRVQDCLRTCREYLPGHTRLVGAAALHSMVAVGQGGKFGLGRYGAIIGRKRPLFDACRKIYQENSGQGLQSGRRQEVPRARDPRIVVGPLQKLVMMEMDPAPRIFRADLRASRCRVRSLHFRCRADMCRIRRIKFNRQ